MHGGHTGIGSCERSLCQQSPDALSPSDRRTRIIWCSASQTGVLLSSTGATPRDIPLASGAFFPCTCLNDTGFLDAAYARSLCARQNVGLTELAGRPTSLIEPTQTELSVRIEVLNALGKHPVDSGESGVDRHWLSIRLQDRRILREDRHAGPMTACSRNSSVIFMIETTVVEYKEITVDNPVPDDVGLPGMG